jgi:FkbM family methyltransferase
MALMKPYQRDGVMFDFTFSGFPDRILTAAASCFPFSTAVVFGAGGRGRDALVAMASHRVEVLALSDNDESKHGRVIHGVKVIEPAALQEMKCPIVIASNYENEIFAQLGLLGLKDIYFFRSDDLALCRQAEEISANIVRLRAVDGRLADDESREMFRQAVKMRTFKHDGVVKTSAYTQYDHPLVCVRPGDVVLDIGGMYGETAIFYANKTGKNCTVYTFEPSPSHLPVIRARIEGLGDVIRLVPKGAWSRSETLCFDADYPDYDPGSHRICENGKETIDVIDIDTFFKDKCSSVDLIKMDIEGAEMDALQGSKNTIAKHLPRLQISIYHKPSHLWEILEYIDSLAPGYEFYVGHHSTIPTETVLYAAHKR